MCADDSRPSDIIARGSGLQSRACGVRGGERRDAAHEVRRGWLVRLALRERLRARLGNAPGDVCEAIGNGGARGVSRIRATSIAPAWSSCSSLDSSQVRWRALSLQLDTALWESAVPGYVQWGKRGILVHELDLRNGTTGRIYANGELPVNGPMDFDRRRARAADRESRRAGRERSRGDGNHRLAGEARGNTARARAFAGAFSVMDASYRGAPLPDLRTGFQYANEKLVSHAEIVRNGGRRSRTSMSTRR